MVAPVSTTAQLAKLEFHVPIVHQGLTRALQTMQHALLWPAVVVGHTKSPQLGALPKAVCAPRALLAITALLHLLHRPSVPLGATVQTMACQQQQQ